jgi:RNA polymerase sigma-70 factor (ECF subfamily)
MTTTATLPPIQDLSDEALMHSLALGRQDALELLYRRHGPLVCNRITQALDRPAAEEIVQDVFLTVWHKADSFDPGRGSFRGWILRMALFRIRNELRRRRRRPQVEPDPAGLCLAALTDEAPEPAEAIWRQHQRAAVRAAVAQLPPLQRQALALAFFEELTHEQVSHLLNLPLGTVKTRIRAGLQKLRAHFPNWRSTPGLAIHGSPHGV